MRLVNYKVMRVDGSEFHTTNHVEATEGGNRIIETYLTDYSLTTPTEEQERERDEHIRKVDEYLKAKRG